MNSAAPLTADVVRRLLRYEPETGRLFWLPRPMELFPDARSGKIWNTRFAGRQALNSARADGYLRGSVFDHDVLAHRVAWAVYTGLWPVGLLDHRNMDRSDNRISNLRVASFRQNNANRTSKSGSTSKYLGVDLRQRDGRWRSRVRAEGHMLYLGSFEDELDAAFAYDAAARKIHGEFARLNFPEIRHA